MLLKDNLPFFVQLKIIIAREALCRAVWDTYWWKYRELCYVTGKLGANSFDQIIVLTFLNLVYQNNWTFLVNCIPSLWTNHDLFREIICNPDCVLTEIWTIRSLRASVHLVPGSLWCTFPPCNVWVVGRFTYWPAIDWLWANEVPRCKGGLQRTKSSALKAIHQCQ